MKPLLALLLLAGCAVQRLEADKSALAANDHAAIAALPPPCEDPAPECRQAQEIRAEACRHLAAAAQAAIAEGAGDPASHAAALLLAADGLRHAAPADPEGCRAAQSARLTQALLAPAGTARCGILAAVPAACGAAKPVTGQAVQLAAALNDQHRSHGCP
jgi:hypothetical protein